MKKLTKHFKNGNIRKSFSQEEIDYILKNYTKVSNSEIASKLGRSKSSIRNIASRANKKRNKVKKSESINGISLGSRYSQYKHGAESRDYSFNITLAQFTKLVQKNCFYCDEPPKLVKAYSAGKNRTQAKLIAINGIDRLNNTVGYELKNCVPCCYDCNKMKMDRDFEEFIEKVKVIYKHNLKKE